MGGVTLDGKDLRDELEVRSRGSIPMERGQCLQYWSELLRSIQYHRTASGICICIAEQSRLDFAQHVESTVRLLRSDILADIKMRSISIPGDCEEM